MSDETTESDDFRTLSEFAQPIIAPINMWGRDLRTGWFACEHPEKPTDGFVLWHYDRDAEPCHGCQIAASALLMRHPDDTHVQWLVRKLVPA